MKILLPVLTLVSIFACFAFGPQAKPPQTNKPVVLGTKQLPGEFGKFGTTYTIGKAEPLNFTLLSAEYRADRFIGSASTEESHSFVPGKGQKLLVIKYSVQNPNPRDTRLWYASFDITAVSPDSQNSRIINLPWIGSNKKYQDVQLKPAQKVILTAAMYVAGEGETPKLIVQRTQDAGAAVVRYDLRGKVAKMAAPYSEDGITSLDSVKIPLDTYFPWHGADLKVVGAEKVAEPIRDFSTPATMSQYALKLGFKGITPSPGRIWYGQFKLLVKTSDGDLIEQNTYGRLLRMSSADRFEMVAPTGEEVNARLIFDLPNNAKPYQVKLSLEMDGPHRTYSVDLPQ